MHPAQTSLIPVYIALARFLENQGLIAIFSNYPYWYLGTTPYRFLTGPVLPLVLVGLHKVFPASPAGGPGFSLFDVMFGLLIVVWFVGGIGVYLLVRSLVNSSTARFPAILAAFFYLFGPIAPFLFRFSDGLSLVSFSFLPITMLGYLKFLKEDSKKSGDYLIAAIVFIMLLDFSILPILILGMAAVFLATFGWRKAEEKIKKSFKLLAFSLLLATIWYSPMYWRQFLMAPSFAGKSLFRVIGLVGQLLPISLVLGLAIVSDKFFKLKSEVSKLCFYWLFIFGFLTFIRFISDPDFWLDWSVYGTELQLGLAIGLGLILDRFLATLKCRTPTSVGDTEKLKFSVFQNIFSVSMLLLLSFGTWLFLFNRYVLGTLQQDITQSVEYQIGVQLSKVVRPGETVFLSGSTVFWLNAFFDLAQVRGGVDQASVHPRWRQAAWELREGEDIGKSLKWLNELKIDYLVVHTKDSGEFYHDFKQPEKFEDVEALEKIYDRDGDRIYRVLN